MKTDRVNDPLQSTEIILKAGRIKRLPVWMRRHIVMFVQVILLSGIQAVQVQDAHGKDVSGTFYILSAASSLVCERFLELLQDAPTIAKIFIDNDLKQMFLVAIEQCTYTVPDSKTSTRLLSNRPQSRTADRRFPNFIAANRAGTRVYTSNFDSTLSVTDVSGQTPDKFIMYPTDIGGGAMDFQLGQLAVHPMGHRVYILNTIFELTLPASTLKANTLEIVNTENNTPLTSVPLPGIPNDLAVSPSGGTVYVATTDIDIQGTGRIDFLDSGKINLIDTATHTLTKSIPVTGNPPALLAMHPDGSRLYVAVARHGSSSAGPFPATVLVIDTDSHQVLKTIELAGGFPRRMAIHPRGTSLYLAYFREDIFLEVVDTETQLASKTIPFPADLDDPVLDPVVNDVCYTPDGSQAFVSVNLNGDVEDRIYSINASTHTINDFFPLPPFSEPGRIAFQVQVDEGQIPLATFSSESEYLHLPEVEVPGLGVFNASLLMTDPLVFKLGQAHTTATTTEQPAVYSRDTGALSLPAVGVDNAAFYEVKLNTVPDPENLLFKVGSAARLP